MYFEELIFYQILLYQHQKKKKIFDACVNYIGVIF